MEDKKTKLTLQVSKKALEKIKELYNSGQLKHKFAEVVGLPIESISFIDDDILSVIKLKNTLIGHKNYIARISWSPDGELLASPSVDGTINIWKINSGEIYQSIYIKSEIYEVTWSPNGENIAFCAGDNKAYIWNINTGKIEVIADASKQNDIFFSISWSPNGKYLILGTRSGSIELLVFNFNDIIYDSFYFPQSHEDAIWIASWSANNRYLATGSKDKTIKLWVIKEGKSLSLLEGKLLSLLEYKTLVGHHSDISSISWSPDSSFFASVASHDTAIRIWSVNGRLILRLEGHTSAISSISFSYDGSLLASKSQDGNVSIWNYKTGEKLINIDEPMGHNMFRSLAFHPNKNILASLNEGDCIIRIWDIDINQLLFSNQINKTIKNEFIHYVNAKVVLLGESGVGKSGLGIRIAEKIFRKTKSTHGAQFWQISLPENIFSTNQLAENVNAELTLWDLAGQPDYHLIHQLFLDSTDVALLLFDCSDATDSFRGVPYWAKVLKKQAPERAIKYLISSRCDVSPVTVDQREINGKLVEYELDDYFCTSAFTGQGIEELLQHILNNVPWDKLPRTSTPKLFQLIREYLLEQKEVGKTLLSFEQIQTEVSQRYTEGVVNEEEIETVINLLQARGFVCFLEPTPNLSLVLLKPELINKYASSIIQAARHEGVGAILERDVVCANLSFAGFESGERLPAAEEKLILESTVELFIRRNLGFREMGRLIFPSQLNIRQEIPADKHPPTEVTYEFSGSVEAIYASLVVCLSYTKDFQREQLWKYAAEFSREGHHLGFAMQQAEGTGELEIYFYDRVTDFDRVTFIRFIQDHLHKKGIDLKERIRLYCPECDKEVTNREAIETRVKAGKLQIPCQYCDASVIIPRSIEEKYRSDRAYIQKQQELQATIKERTRQEVIAFREDREQYMSETDKQIRILHLSDIHLGTTDQAKNYFTQLATDLTQNLKVKQLNYLVLSGDIANYSTVEEYDAAFELVDKLVSRYGLNPERVITVPGNHDLNWDLSEEAYDFVSKRKLPKSLKEGQYIDAGDAGALIPDQERYQQRFKHFSDRFYKKVYSKPYPLEYERQAILHPCPDDKILFLALNSCWELDHHYKDRSGINSNAISHAVEQILNGNYDDWLKIAVWHHPVTSAESMKNVAFLEQLAVNGFQVAMHGHIHEAKDENFQYDINRRLRIIAAGTFGAPAKEQVTGIPLQYNLLVLNPDNGELTVETRKKERADGAWSADARWSDKNNPVPSYTIPLNYGSVKKKSDNVTSQANKASTENLPDNPENSLQSILKNVSVGGNLTTGNISQILNLTVPQSNSITQNHPPQRTILVLAASPTDMPGLRLDKEIREIDEGLRLAKQRDSFKLEQRLAVRNEDLRRALLQYEPQIVHFCGHGETDGIFLENDAGTKQLVPKEALTNLFKLFSKRGVQCVVLNACYSAEQAKEISEHINFVVGMSRAVGDKAAIQFAVGFYDALGAGWSYEDAYELGCNTIALEGIPEELTPVLKKKVQLTEINSVETLVQQVRSHYCEKVQNLYGRIQLLNRKQVDVDSLYVDVYFLEKLSSESYATTLKLIEGLDSRDSFDRLGLGKRQKRSPGLEAVEQSSRLVILGKPGSGKSTFLRYLVVACCKKELFPDCIPILIELRYIGDVCQFDPIALIHKEFRLTDLEQTKQILNDGKVLILLDGLDEVPTRSQKTVQDRLIKFSQQYYKNRFILTCRTQTTEYILTGFDYVEVADFNPEQVNIFSQNWFTALAKTPQEGKELTKQFITKLRLPENKQTAELASTPILLSLTCWIFTDLEDLLSKRSDLYERGLNLLLNKCDETKGINRDSGSEIYRQLLTAEKNQVLSYLAAKKIQQKQPLLFEQSEIKQYIAEYLKISNEESETVLKAIEEQHGLLIKRAQEIWSFSHLTFHEYLAAKWFVDNSQLQDLINLITHKICREVFLLVVEIVNHADELLQQMKIKIDGLVASDKKLQEFLAWIEQKSLLVIIGYKPAAVRAFYLKSNQCSGFSPGNDLACAIDVNLKNDCNGGEFQELNINIQMNFPSPPHTELHLDDNLDAILANWLESSPDFFALPFLGSGVSTNDDFDQLLSNLLNQLPEDLTSQDWWWHEKGSTWTEQLRNLSLKHRLIGLDWQFSKEQKELLMQYYDANKLLVDCLNSCSVVSDEVRKEIEETLLLPIAEIEKRKQSNS